MVEQVCGWREVSCPDDILSPEALNKLADACTISLKASDELDTQVSAKCSGSAQLLTLVGLKMSCQHQYVWNYQCVCGRVQAASLSCGAAA